MFDFTGYGENLLTFKTENEEILGCPVTTVSNDTVALAEADTAFCGIAVSVRGGAAAVQMAGYVTLPYSGDMPGYGVQKLASNGAGGVMVSENGVSATVVRIDAENSKIAFIF